MEPKPHPLTTRQDLQRVHDNLAEAARFWQAQPLYTVNHFRAAVVDLEGIIRRLPPDAAPSPTPSPTPPADVISTIWGPVAVLGKSLPLSSEEAPDAAMLAAAAQGRLMNRIKEAHDLDSL